MKIEKKRLSAAIALILTLTMITALPFAYGQFLPNARESFAFVAASVDVIGKGENIVITGWVYPPPSVQYEWYTDYKFTVTKPDGTTLIRTMNSSIDATASFNFVPDQTGNWSVVLDFPGDLVRLNRLPSVSVPYKFTVTEEPVPSPDYTALPANRWTWPVSQVNQEWWRITGGWYTSYSDGYSNTNWYSPAPNTAHILWKQPFICGGLLGGDQGHMGIVRPENVGDEVLSDIVAYHGRLYYTDRLYLTGGNDTWNPVATEFDSVPIVKCVDMYSGELLWQTALPTVNYTTGKSVAAARAGATTLQIVAYASAKSHEEATASGAIELFASGGGLWCINPLSGAVLRYQLEPALSPKYFDGAWYINNYPERGLFSCLSAEGGPLSASPIIIWQKNVTETGIAMSAVTEGYVIQLQTNSTTGQKKLNTWDAYTGDLVANGTYGGYWANDGSNPAYGNGIYTYCGADGKTYALSFKTGSLLWTSDHMDFPWGSFGTYRGTVGMGIVAAGSYAHYMYAYNATTGALVWKQDTSIDNPYDSDYAQQGPPTWGVKTIADNKVYYASGEHSPMTPTGRGDMLYCNDIPTGELLWRLAGFKGNRYQLWAGVADGMYWSYNQYDGDLYMFGKGDTKTTVSASQSPVVEGGSTVIQGRVTDVSPGTKILPFPDGVPAVSDEGMSDWMAYLYTLQTTGPLVNLDNVKGVKVTLTALGSDGSTIGIGDVTADRDGHFSYMWSPPNADCVYTVLASFAGSESYYASYGETSVGVTAAAPTPAPPEAQPDNTPMFIGSTAAIIIAIAIVAVLLLRKRP
jgi:outer membrane protein assembly factor BamB